MKSRKLLILAVSVLSIIGIGIYSQFLNELEGIPIQEKQQYLPIVINDETTLYEIHKIDGKNLIKYATTDLFNIFSSVEDLVIVYDELSTKKGLFKLKSKWEVFFLK